MVLREASVAVVAIIALLAAAGYGASKIFKKDDTLVEEYAESAIENIVEDALGLDEDALDGLVDFSFDSPEKGDGEEDD